MTHEQCWDAVRRRDPAADFFYAVRTTGVYCRPSCASRSPRPENVEFHATRAAAEAAGFRPCKRCRPDGASPQEEQAAAVTRACRLLESSEKRLSLAELAGAAGMSPHHFHRVFKALAGVTPARYAASRRAQRLRQQLDAGASVTEAIHEAGYGSTSRFYENSRLGMTPTRYRSRGEQMQIRFAVGPCSLGHVLVGATERGVCFVALGDEPDPLLRDLQDRFPRAELVGGDAGFEGIVGEVLALADDPARVVPPLPFDIRGTAFQQRVWEALQAIAPGSTATYAEIALRLGNPRSTRAVAQACAANPLALLVPCHRVVRSDGQAGGYRWGVERKSELLKRERSRHDGHAAVSRISL